MQVIITNYGRYMMVRVRVETLTLKQIETLESQLAAAKAKASASAKSELKAKIDALLASSNFTIGDIYPALARGRGRSKSPARYANPSDPTQTWTGRGRRPAWLLALLKKGAKLESLSL